jgi:hypothetical protein
LSLAYPAREKEENNTEKKYKESVVGRLPIYPLEITQLLNMLSPKYMR